MFRHVKTELYNIDAVKLMWSSAPREVVISVLCVSVASTTDIRRERSAIIRHIPAVDLAQSAVTTGGTGEL